MAIWYWLEGLTPHQLDALRTAASCVGFGLVPVLTLLAGWAVRILRGLRHEAERTARHTAWTEYVDGEAREVSVTDAARDPSEQSRRARIAAEVGRQETADLGVWVKGMGRRRAATETVQTIQASGESKYE